MSLPTIGDVSMVVPGSTSTVILTTGLAWVKAERARMATAGLIFILSKGNGGETDSVKMTLLASRLDECETIWDGRAEYDTAVFCV